MSILGYVVIRVPCLVAFGFGCRHIVLDKFGQSLGVNPKGKRRERDIPDIDCLDSTYRIIVLVLLDTENGFGLIVDFGSDMSACVLIALVLMNDGVDVKIVFFRPIHQMVDYKSGFAGIVNVKHQVTDAVNDYQPDSRGVPNLMVNHADAVFHRIFTESVIFYALLDFRVAPVGQSSDTLEYSEGVIFALLGVEV